MDTMRQSQGQPKPKLLDRVRQTIRTRHYSRRTEASYVAWIKRFIFFHGKRHPAEMGELEVTQFLSSLAVDSAVAASTQNQALSALLFLYKEVLGQPLPWLDNLVYAHRPRRLPIVLTREEVQAILTGLYGTPSLMATLLYGAGLRVLECCRLRVSIHLQHQRDVERGVGWVELPAALGRKYPNAPPICSRTGTTSAQCRSSWVIPTLAPP